MRTPFFRIVFPLALGIVLADVTGSGHPAVGAFCWVLAAGTLCLNGRSGSMSGRTVLWSAIGVMLAAAGTGYFVRWVQQDATSGASMQVESMGSGLWEGVVCGHIRTDPSGRLRSFRFCPDHAKATGLLVRFPFPGAHEDWLVHDGDHLRMVALVRLPQRRRNPYDFDEQRWLHSLGIVAVATPDSIVIRHPELDTGRWFYRIRAALAGRFEGVFPTRTSSDLYQAMILGERDALPDRLADAFRMSGLSHLLAISGLHVAVLATAVYFLVGFPLRVMGVFGRTRSVVRSVLVVVLLILYGSVVGWSASVQRAVIMSSLVATAQAGGRRNATWNALFAAGTLILIQAPDQLYQPGFQLSFSAVSGILAFVRAAPAGQGKVQVALRSSILVSLAAGAATLPPLLFHFGRVSLASLLFSPVAVAALSTGLPLAWLALLLPSVLSEPVAQVAALLGHAQVVLAGTGADTAWIPVWRVDPGSFSVVFLIPCLVLGLWVLRPGRVRTRGLCLVMAVCAWGVWQPLLRHAPYLDVMILDVGQGDGLVVRAPSGRVLVIDTGPGPGSARSLITHIRAWSTKPPSVVLLSHDHLDHTGGWPLVQQAWEGDLVLDDVHRGDRVVFDPQVRVFVLHPPSKTQLDANNQSVVLKISYGETSFLLTGDIEGSAEQELSTRYGKFLRSDAVKVAHHGSRSSSSSNFVKMTSARWALISAGTSNRFGHPHREVVRRWRSAGARTWTTGNDGGFWLRSNGRRLMVAYPSQ